MSSKRTLSRVREVLSLAVLHDLVEGGGVCVLGVGEDRVGHHLTADWRWNYDQNMNKNKTLFNPMQYKLFTKESLSVKCSISKSHKEELLDFKLNQHFIYFQTEQFRNTVVTHRWIDINC